MSNERLWFAESVWLAERWEHCDLQPLGCDSPATYAVRTPDPERTGWACATHLPLVYDSVVPEAVRQLEEFLRQFRRGLSAHLPR